MNWTVRLIEMRDVPVLLDWYNNEELHYIANAKKFKLYTLEQLIDYWTEKLSRPNSSYYVIEVSGEIVGRVGLKKKNREKGVVTEYSILIGVPTMYSKGLGTEITKHFVKEVFLDPEPSSVILEVRADNLRAISCYKKVGFQITSEFVENEVKIYAMEIAREGE
ncbi:GNAT family N-acetyltransferase [Fredinandcohnia humi]